MVSSRTQYFNWISTDHKITSTEKVRGHHLNVEVYLEPVHLGWKPLVQSWAENFKKKCLNSNRISHEPGDGRVLKINWIFFMSCTEVLKGKSSEKFCIVVLTSNHFTCAFDDSNFSLLTSTKRSMSGPASCKMRFPAHSESLKKWVIDICDKALPFLREETCEFFLTVREVWQKS